MFSSIVSAGEHVCSGTEAEEEGPEVKQKAKAEAEAEKQKAKAGAESEKQQAKAEAEAKKQQARAELQARRESAKMEALEAKNAGAEKRQADQLGKLVERLALTYLWSVLADLVCSQTGVSFYVEGTLHVCTLSDMC